MTFPTHYANPRANPPHPPSRPPELVAPAAPAYADIKAVNWSALKHLAVSPLLFQWRVAHPEPEKDAYTLGSAIHCLILEPEKFDARYAVYEARRAGKEWDAWQETHPGVEALKPAEMDAVRAVASAVADHPVAHRALSGGRVEETTTWADKETSLACKGRIDFIRPNRVVDLKSARDVSPAAFARTGSQYLYHGQLAFYHDGCIAAGKIPIDAAPPQIVAVQKTEPYDVAVYTLTADALNCGRRLYRGLLDKLAACLEADLWPGCAPTELPLDVAAWAPGGNPDISEEF